MPAPDLIAADQLGGPDPGAPVAASFNADTADESTPTPDVSASAPPAQPPPQAQQPAPIQNGPGVWDSIRQALPLVIAGIAAKTGGPLAGAGLLKGLNDAQERKRLELEKQAALHQAYTHQNLDDQIRLQQEQGAQQQRQSAFFQNAIKELNGIDDPVQFAATAKLFDDTSARVFGTDPGTISGAVKFDNTKALTKTKADAQTVLDRVGKQFASPDDPTGAQFIASHPDYSVTFRGKPTKFSELQAVVGLDVSDASGQRAAPTAQPALVDASKNPGQAAIVAEQQRRKTAGLPPMTQAEATKIAQDATTAYEAKLAGQKTAAEAANKPASASGGAMTAPGNPPPSLHGQDYLNTLDPSTATTIKALAEGRMEFPRGTALRSPQWSALVQGVMQYDPAFDEAQASNNARTAVRKDFTSGKSAQTINALNTVAGHLAELQQQAGALGNTSIDWYNGFKNWVKTHIGIPDVTNFNTTRKAVSDELTRVYRQAGGSEADTQAWQAAINSSQSPEQLAGAFATVGRLIESKLNAMQQQAQQGMGIAPISVVSPDARAKLSALQGQPAGAPASFAVSYGGKTYTFPSQAALDGFKKEMGIQ